MYLQSQQCTLLTCVLNDKCIIESENVCRQNIESVSTSRKRTEIGSQGQLTYIYIYILYVIMHTDKTVLILNAKKVCSECILNLFDISSLCSPLPKKKTLLTQLSCKPS